jgi:hypothetical protein
MELKSKNIFESLETEMANFQRSIEIDYNNLIKYENEENNSLLSYMMEVADNLSILHNSMNDLQKILYNINDLFDDIGDSGSDFVIENLKGELKNFHILIKTLLDVLLKYIEVVFRRDISKKSLKTSQKIEVFPELSDELSNLRELITEFDEGRRNKIIHEGVFEDKMINDVWLYSASGWFHEKGNYAVNLKNKKIELLNTKIPILDELCFNIITILTTILDSLETEYYRNEKNLSK